MWYFFGMERFLGIGVSALQPGLQWSITRSAARRSFDDLWLTCGEDVLLLSDSQLAISWAICTTTDRLGAWRKHK